jgi:hypothetical protein
VQI